MTTPDTPSPIRRLAARAAARDAPTLNGPDPGPAFRDLFDEHAAGLHRYVARRIGLDGAEDVVGETFVVALRRRLSFDPTLGDARAWLYGIATNLLRQYLHREIRELDKASRSAYHAPGIIEDHQTLVIERVDAHERVRVLANRLAQLAPGDRDVLLLTAWAELDSTAVATALGIPIGTVRSRLHRVRRQLRGDARTPDATLSNGDDT